MSATYGIEVVATDLRISTVVLGQWGTHRSHQESMLKAARRINCPLEFYVHEKDRILPYQQELFEAFCTEEKACKKLFQSLRFTATQKQSIKSPIFCRATL